MTRANLREVQRAARRFDTLARRTVLPDVDEIVFQSVYELAELPPPPSKVPDHRGEWRRVLATFFGVDEPGQVTAVEEGDRLVVRMRASPGLGQEVQIVQPREFVRHAREKIDAMRRRLGHIGPVTDAQVVRDVVADILPNAWAEIGHRLRIPKEVVIRAVQQDNDRVLRSPFMIRTFCENVYYHFRAFPLRVGAEQKPMRVHPNDAPDLALTTYFTPGRYLVTDDRVLRRLLGEVLNTAKFLLTFEEFMDQALAS